MVYIFVEGHFDEDYFSKLFFVNLNENTFIQYSSLKVEKVNAFIRSIKSMPNCDYLFFADADGLQIQEKREKILSQYNIESEKLCIVQYEIESWYYAGVCQEECLKLKMKHFEYKTDVITKEMLKSKMKKPSENQLILAKMLEIYSIDLAVLRNDSFKSFFEQHIREPIAAVL